MSALQSPLVRSFFEGRILPALFALLALRHVLSAFTDGWIGVDAEIYLRGSAAWLAGRDPWQAYSVIEAFPDHFHYSALPTMVVLGAPFTLLSESLAVAVWIALSALAGLYAVRRLGMPLYWLAFPPLVEGVLSGNPSIVLLALIVSGSSLAAAVAAMLKVYAVVPLLAERRVRALIICGLSFAVTLVAWPLWLTYLTDFGARSSRLLAEAGGGFSGYRDPLLFALGALSIVALIRLGDVRAAGWLAVPAIWPATQFHYSTLAMPVMHPILAVGLAYPTWGLPPLAVGLYAIWRLAAKRREFHDRMSVCVTESAVPLVGRLSHEVVASELTENDLNVYISERGNHRLADV